MPVLGNRNPFNSNVSSAGINRFDTPSNTTSAWGVLLLSIPFSSDVVVVCFSGRGDKDCAEVAPITAKPREIARHQEVDGAASD